MHILDLRQSLLALDVIGDEVHRARPIERDQRDDVVDASEHRIASQSSSCRRIPAGRCRWFRRDCSRSNVGWSSSGMLLDARNPGACCRIKCHCVVDDGERFQPEEIHLQQPEIGQRPHRILADDVVSFRCRGGAGCIRTRSRSPITTPAACTPALRDKPFEHGRVIPELAGRRLGLDGSFQLGIFLRGRSSVMFSSFGIIFAIRSASP